ncbi:hypothetical protein [Staphylococcus phage SAP6]|nr:hypothetical protein [Staphylococcus phage StAP1]WAW12250.1 hypothetical protein [Staphylococcus phage SAP6]
MCKEKVHRQLSNAIEILATYKEWWSFPKELSPTETFKIINWKEDTLVFEVRDNGNYIGRFSVATPIIDFHYDRIKKTTAQYMINYFVKLVCKDMYTYYKLQRGQ